MPSSQFAAACLRYGALCALTSLSLFGSPLASAGDALTVSGTPPTTATVGTAYSFQPMVSDPSGLTVTFKIYNKPSWASFDSATGRLYGTPGSANIGSYGWVQIAGSDGQTTSWLPAYTLTVSGTTSTSTSSTTTSTSGGTTLVVSGTPPTTATVGTAYSFQPTASVPSGQTVSFKIYNKPSWASFDTTTGRLYGTPAAANVGAYHWVQIAGYDAQTTSWLPAYTLTVSGTTSTPTSGTTTSTSGTTTSTSGTTTLVVSGTPPTTATVGTAYSFQPTASVPSGQTVSFKIYNKPSWASFDTTTGRLYGTPAAANVGTYHWVQIAGYDAQTTSWLPAYTLTVSGTTVSTSSTGSATISWTPPTQNTDGSALTNLAGYHIYYGTSQTSLTKVVNITNPGLTTYVLSNLSAATWYFAMTSVNTSGMESARSAVQSYAVP